MDHHHRDQPLRSSYRLVVAGVIGERWLDWFGADRVECEAATTAIAIQVVDQAELWGRLRRLQDLNVQLLELKLVPPGSDASP